MTATGSTGGKRRQDKDKKDGREKEDDRVATGDNAATGKVLGEGVVAGLLGAAAVALWFFIFDLARGQALFTPGALGSVVFYGADTLDRVRITAGTVLGYTVIHLLLFSLVGVTASAFLNRAGRVPHLIIGGLILFVAMEAFFLGALTIVAEFLLGSLAWWTVAVGNLLAVVAMGAFFGMRHPGLRSAVLQADTGEDLVEE